jgi:hypothetical protein
MKKFGCFGFALGLAHHSLLDPSCKQFLFNAFPHVPPGVFHPPHEHSVFSRGVELFLEPRNGL